MFVPRKYLAVAAVAAAVGAGSALLTGVAAARPGQPAPAGPTGPVPARTVWEMAEFQSVADGDPWTTASGVWTDVPGAAEALSPAGLSAFHATFTAESNCTGGSWCSVRIVVVLPDTTVVELEPAAGLDFAFDSPDGGAWQSNAVQRTSAALPGGATYTVQVQAATAGGAQLRLDDWNLAVLRLD